jgi:hypothetical protein
MRLADARLIVRSKEAVVVLWDIGLRGLGILIGYSLVFGVVAQLVLWRATGTRWLWLIGATGWFIGGLFASEVLFATATIDQLQPIEDGLVFDEAMFGGLIVGLALVLITWYVTRRSGSHQPSPA